LLHGLCASGHHGVGFWIWFLDNAWAQPRGKYGRHPDGHVQNDRLENLKAILGPTYKSWLLPWADSLKFDDDFEIAGHVDSVELPTLPASGQQLEEVKVQ